MSISSADGILDDGDELPASAGNDPEDYDDLIAEIFGEGDDEGEWEQRDG